MKINVNKTKVCIFEKRKQAHNLEFYIGGEKLEIVDNFTYFGIDFTHTGNFDNAVKVLLDQELRAYHNLSYIVDQLNCKIQMISELFDKMITPILLYGSEVWGIYCIKEIDGYDVYHLDRKDKKGGGVAIFVNNVFNHRIIN